MTHDPDEEQGQAADRPVQAPAPTDRVGQTWGTRGMVFLIVESVPYDWVHTCHSCVLIDDASGLLEPLLRDEIIELCEKSWDDVSWNPTWERIG